MGLKLYSVLLFVLCAKSLQVSGASTTPPTQSTNLGTAAATDPTATDSTKTDATEASKASTPEATATDSTKTDATEASTSSTPEDDEGSFGLLNVANVESNLYAIYNVTGRAGLIVDINNNLIALINGTLPRGVLIDIESKKGSYATFDDIALKTVSIRDWLTSLKDGLKPFLTLENATKFELDNVSPLILEEINRILEKLIIGISEELENNPKDGLELFIAVGSEILRLKQGVLNGSIPVLGIKGAFLRADLAGNYNAIKGLAIIFGKIPGGIPAILQAGGEIQYQKIANGRNGLERLAALIRGIGKAKDIGDKLGDIFNNPETLLRVVDLLSGSYSIGLAGVLKVAAAAAKYANEDKSLEYFINVTLQFSAANSQNGIHSEEISSQLKQSITILLEAIDEVQLTESLSGAVEVLRSLDKGNLQINKVKISSIVSALISATNQPKELQTVANILNEIDDY